MDSAVSSTQRASDAASQRRRVRDGDAARVRRSQQQQQQPQQQHFHRHRQARMLLPHGGYATGLLFTINPQHAARATREAQLYLSTLTRDLQAADARADDNDDDDAHPQSMRSEHNNNDKDDNDDAMTRRAAPSTSTMSLLARELADAAATAATRPRQQQQRVRRHHSSSSSDGVDDDDDDAQTTAKRHCAGGRDDAPSSLPPPTRSCQQWLRVLETHCKGYLFVCVPPPPPARQLTNEQQQQPQHDDDGANSTSSRSDDRDTSSRDAHVIAANPRVSCVVERVFADLQREPRPLFRSCFRLAPVELCCCPTVAEMQAGVRALLALHFPVTSSSGATTTTTAATTTATDASAATPPRRTMHTIALQLIVKNNTGVAMQRAVLYAALHAAVPANRFIVLPPSHVSSNNNNNNSNTSTQDVVAVVCVHVLHSTCCMGVQRAYTQRCGYNVHALGTAALELAHDMTRRTPRDADDDADDAS